MAQEQARQAAQQPASPLDGLFGLVDDFISGRPINREKIAATVNDAIRNVVDGHDVQWTWDPPAFPGAPRRRRAVPPAHPPDELAAKRAAIAKAKVALGFAAGEPVTLEQIKKRQRELARRYHPDRPGGSLEKMQLVNSAVDLLEQAL